MNRSLILATFLMTATAASAQSLSEKIEVSLVNVDVTVTTHGAPARGLTRDDFEVLEDGKPQTITSFYAVEREPQQQRAQAGPAPAAPIVATPAATDDRSRRKVLVIIDYLHSSKIERNRALTHLQTFVADRFGTGEYEWSIMVVGLSARTILPLTSDSERARAAIEALRNDAMWQPSPDAQPISLDVRLPDADPTDVKNNIFYSSKAFNAVRSGLRGFAALEGKKIVLLLTNGFGRAFDEDPAMFPAALSGNAAAVVSGLSGRLFTMRDHLIREANAANVNLYIVDTGGIQSPGTKGGLYWLARETGGTFLSGNYVNASLKSFDELSSNFYSLAYRPTHPDDGKYHRITVRLKVPGSYRLQYRDGYGMLPLEARLEHILTTPAAALLAMQHSAISLALDPGQPRTAGGASSVVPLRVTLPLQNLQFMPGRRGADARVDFFISVFEEGRSVGVQRYTTKAHANTGENTEKGVMTYDALIRMRRGRHHTVVVAVHDQASDAVGYAARDIGF